VQWVVGEINSNDSPFQVKSNQRLQLAKLINKKISGTQYAPAFALS
jgi:hypothetical protein